MREADRLHIWKKITPSPVSNIQSFNKYLKHLIMKKRETGFYWVKRTVSSGWEPAYFDGEDNWLVIGDSDNRWVDSEFEEICGTELHQMMENVKELKELIGNTSASSEQARFALKTIKEKAESIQTIN